MTEERQRLEAVKAEFESFVGSKIHKEYVASTQRDVSSVELRILEDDITSIPDLFTLIELRATRRVLRSNLTSFEDTVANLNARIAEMKLAEETKNATKQPTENDENDQETDDDAGA